MIRVTGESVVCAGIIGLRGIYGICKDGRRVSEETSPRKHGTSSHSIASLSTVLCSTGTILRRKGNGRESNIEGRKFEEERITSRSAPFPPLRLIPMIHESSEALEERIDLGLGKRLAIGI